MRLIANSSRLTVDKRNSFNFPRTPFRLRDVGIDPVSFGFIGRRL